MVHWRLNFGLTYGSIFASYFLNATFITLYNLTTPWQLFISVKLNVIFIFIQILHQLNYTDIITWFKWIITQNVGAKSSPYPTNMSCSTFFDLLISFLIWSYVKSNPSSVGSSFLSRSISWVKSFFSLQFPQSVFFQSKSNWKDYLSPFELEVGLCVLSKIPQRL
jgi:hypothetical protein